MLIKNPNERIDVYKAFNHPWLQKASENLNLVDEEKEIIQRIGNFKVFFDRYSLKINWRLLCTHLLCLSCCLLKRNLFSYRYLSSWIAIMMVWLVRLSFNLLWRLRRVFLKTEWVFWWGWSIRIVLVISIWLSLSLLVWNWSRCLRRSILSRLFLILILIIQARFRMMKLHSFYRTRLNLRRALRESSRRLIRIMMGWLVVKNLCSCWWKTIGKNTWNRLKNCEKWFFVHLNVCMSHVWC